MLAMQELRAGLRSTAPTISVALRSQNRHRLISSTIRLNDETPHRSSGEGETVTKSEQSTPQSSENISEPSTRDASATTGVSRDMTHSAESSSRASVVQNVAESESPAREIDPGVADEDRQFAQLFDTLREKWPKARPSTTSPDTETDGEVPSPRPQSIASRLSFSQFSTPSPRAPRGVHSRQRRSAGQTPQEAETFNKILSDIFSDLQSSASASGTSSSSTSTSRLGSDVGPGSGGRFGGTNTPFGAAPGTTRNGNGNAIGGGGFGFGLSGDRAKGLRRLFDREGEEESDESVEELEMLKEEMEVIGSDVELLEWAKNRVFKPLSVPAAHAVTNAIVSTTTSDTDVSPATPSASTTTTSLDNATPPTLPPILSFSRAYPKILAHLLRTLRVNYNSPHLLLSIFHHAQTSSLESYLSGCLTGAYNEVLICRWESFRDLEGVEAGVREMEIMGVEWDSGTARIVGRVVEEVGKEVLSSKTNGRWGEEVLERLGKLEKKVQKDVRTQERYFENTQKTKRRAREDRERKLEREGREGRAEEGLSRIFG
ncbi:hypothetical protein CI109_102928 [Kwoniella shandongensis]|uniref:Mtf2-like C-terminal domain-containing protein n=1 Tax=Kwoniella shandongensis TaxID=1734106 RepID=A0A5M6C807_9TREE|nr:uncharacterized protein CI109_000116 [Kwoniella shandongensis]KAA5531276.1 hypothetical protein CI109_000116 [Kwoniella shandongensis]